MKITTLLVDDHAIVRDGLRYVLETESDFQIVGEADNGREAVQLTVQHRPDVVIMDVTMPELNGIEATTQIRVRCPDTEVIILSMHPESNYIARAIQAGANGYLLKGSASSEVIQAVRAVNAGQPYFGQTSSDQMKDAHLSRAEADDIEVRDPLAKLSPREREVLQLVVDGKTSAEIAEDLCLAIDTVKTYRFRLMAKLQLDNVPQLVKFAIKHGLTPLE
jgi:RNA polymerase sigma factor (sigma-70 family)